ncbi:MAG: aspartate--ammonia ligase [Coriobacteriia bacterium]|nr:aspartate--ammonia ligase [Coriobacteriia bacterium]
MDLIIPHNYDPILDVRKTQEAIKIIRDTFQYEMESELGLTRISAPLFVDKDSGLNDNLSGVEKPVSFDIYDTELEIVQSLAKWKRMALKKYNFKVGEGLYTNMNAIRKDETLDNLHSVYVDQWDWEKVISKDSRNFETLKSEVDHIYKVIKHLEHDTWYKYPEAVNKLPDEIFYVSSFELQDSYPDLSPKEREDKICKEKGAVFLSQIGRIHDHRAPDYDDWDLNGDILFWYEPLQCALEISSMGIRVDENSLAEQLKEANCEERTSLPYHQAVLNGDLPYTIGGGIGQSRLCMLLLKKAHIGEVQASYWPATMVEKCKNGNIHLL